MRKGGTSKNRRNRTKRRKKKGRDSTENLLTRSFALNRIPGKQGSRSHHRGGGYGRKDQAHYERENTDSGLEKKDKESGRKGEFDERNRMWSLPRISPYSLLAGKMKIKGKGIYI